MASSSTASLRRFGLHDPKTQRLDFVCTFTLGFFFLTILQAYFRGDTRDGIHFTPWSSEFLMQTVAIEDLRTEPFKSLFYLHIQPPMLDGVRALLIWFCPNDLPVPQLIQRVDSLLGIVWTIFYALIGALSCLWVSKLSHRALGYLAAALLFLHPAMLLYVSLLETTLLTAFFSLWISFELYLLTRDEGSAVRLGVSTLAAFLSRSVFQWPAIVILFVSLLLARVPLRKVVWFYALTVPLVAAFTIKQIALFDLSYTSSFAGLNFCRSIGGCEPLTPLELREARAFLDHHPDPKTAGVLSHDKSIPNAWNFNKVSRLREYKRDLLAYKKTLRHKQPRELLLAYKDNAALYLLPSSHYLTHVITERIPWRKPFDDWFSGARLLWLLALSACVWLVRHVRERAALLRGVAVFLPVAFIAATSIVFERGENQRFKFFIEPLFVVFIASQAASLFAFLRDRFQPPKGVLLKP